MDIVIEGIRWFFGSGSAMDLADMINYARVADEKTAKWEVELSPECWPHHPPGAISLQDKPGWFPFAVDPRTGRTMWRRRVS